MYFRPQVKKREVATLLGLFEGANLNHQRSDLDREVTDVSSF